jgi:uncharacterized protein YdcH (DUF465 family)
MVQPDMNQPAPIAGHLEPSTLSLGEFKARKVAVMEKTTQEELKAHLMATNDEFRSLADRHAEYHRQLEELEAKSHLTLDDEAEEHRLKKQKLRLKDQMNEIMTRYRAQQVA